MEEKKEIVEDGQRVPRPKEALSLSAGEEASLKGWPEKYRQVVENAGEGIVVIQGGKVRLANPTLYRLLGYEEEEVRGRSFLEFVHPVDREVIRRRYEERIKGEPVPEVYDIRALAKDGKVRILELRSRFILWEGRPATLNFLADVTERRKTEEKYRLIVETMEEGYYEVDLKGSYTFVNPAVCRYHQAEAEELIGLNYRGFMPPETAERVFKLFNRVYQTGVPARSLKEDVVIIRKDGRHIPLDLTVSLIRDPAGNPVGFRGITFDASERRKLEAEWERYRDFVENVADGCFETDLQGNLTFANPAVLRRYGCTWDDLKGMNNRAYTSPETAKRAFKVFHNVYQTGKPAVLLDYEILQRNGERRYIDLSVSLIRDSAGKPVGFRGISRDVNERKKMEAERERLQQRLNQLQKLEALGTLAGGMAHEFNNILMVIQGYVSLMLLDLDPEQPHYQQLKAIEGQVKNGADLIRQLLGYARLGRFEVQPADLNEVVDRTVTLFKPEEKKILIHSDYAPDLRSVEVDRRQIEQALLGLFWNAAEAMPGGGDLFLKTENVLLDNETVRPFEIPAGPYVKVTVRDNGMGMDEATREKIFDPFFTTKGMGRKSGLGLALVYGIVRGHKGMIEVFSRKGEGTVFSIYLPARQGEETAEKPEEIKPLVLLAKPF